MTVVEAISLGLVQGLTEFLPVSSSGHLALTQHYLGLKEPQLFFDVMVHAGTLLAILLTFSEDVIRMLKGRDWRLVAMILLGSFPTAAIGFVLKGFVERMMVKVWLVSLTLFANGIVLISSSLIARRLIAKLDRITPLRALAVGAAQGVAVIPGISRSGMTISLALVLGLKPEEAAKFSFLLSIPAILGATMLEIKEVSLNNPHMFTTLTGMFTAFVSGYLAIRWLISLLKRGRYGIFGYYCISVAILSSLISHYLVR